ncbi:hypothetical protein P280DRAFT_426465 [Massarina eburnea CBS 473.64]|uniref:WW domain-containing protein n=1 Tax=Massarina eburnea CBS 473.64 TaxID=1395130 RepID=A0A6A6S086_9PLEO|nr:hypothetical protein P280DRAFT_426465 [Massarina eburnea CBS 473.64]
MHFRLVTKRYRRIIRHFRTRRKQTSNQPLREYFDIDKLEPYQYRPLDQEAGEIRLLKILPGNFDDVLRLEIFHAPLIMPERAPDTRMPREDLQRKLPPGWRVYETWERRYIFRQPGTRTQWAHPDPNFDKQHYDCPAVLDPYPNFEPRYEALSYAWGKEEDNIKKVIMSSHVPDSPETTFQMRHNLQLALRHLRQTDNPRIFWVDAISINQGDEQERNIEVKRMGQIYSLAWRVVVWLGPDEPNRDGEKGLDALEWLGGQIEYTQCNTLLRTPADLSDLDIEIWEPERQLPYTESHYKAMHSVLKRAWWDRLWVWQEIHLASHRSIIQCGSQSNPWYLVRRGIVLLQDRRKEGDVKYCHVLPSVVLRKRLDFCNVKLSGDIRLLLEQTRTAQHGREHDRIFALFGFLQPKLVALIEADYSLPIADLFMNVCSAWIKFHRDVMFLRHCDLGCSGSIPEKPSWVPNWLENSSIEKFLYGFASGESNCGSVEYLKKSELAVYGVFCGKVQHVSAPAPVDGSLVTTLRTWDRQFRKISLVQGEKWDQKDLVEVLQCGETDEVLPGFGYSRIEECLRAHGTNDPLTSSRIRGRSLFRLAGGNLGIGPSATQEGDIAVVILGLEAPLILRPSTIIGDQTGYQVVGPAYVNGLMDTEALLGPLPSDYKAYEELDYEGYFIQGFRDSNSGITFYDDPRLGPLPDGWEFSRHYEPSERSFRFYYNTEDREVSKHDPRLSVDELRKRGVDVQRIVLV